MTNCYVNGMPNKSIASKIVSNRIETHAQYGLQKIEHPSYPFIKIEMNNYIGNPK